MFDASSASLTIHFPISSRNRKPVIFKLCSES